MRQFVNVAFPEIDTPLPYLPTAPKILTPNPSEITSVWKAGFISTGANAMHRCIDVNYIQFHPQIPQ